MKQLIVLPLLFTGIVSLHQPDNKNGYSPAVSASTINHGNALNIGAQAEPGSTRMRVIEFKSQEYCRTELKDFDFDARFTIVSATVYFSGANFKNIETGKIAGSSLKPIRSLMDRCTAGSSVSFEDIKVMGPDKEIRSIQGLSLSLY